ncbi:SRPBCC family protein [Cellulomonas soli]
MTALSRWISRLDDRWSRRALFPGSPTERPGYRAVTDVSGEYVGQIARPPVDVWALIAAPGTHFGAQGGFVLPGPGPERWCLLTDYAGGMVGIVAEVLERDEGRRLVLRCDTGQTTFVNEWAVHDAGVTPDGPSSLVRLRMTCAVRALAAEPAASGLQEAARRAVTRLDKQLTGPPEPQPPLGEGTPAGSCAHQATGELVTSSVTVQVVIPLPVEEVWRGVLDASTFTFDAADGEQPGVVPGTPVGQPGELRYVITLRDERLFIRFHDVVAIGPGYRLVTRQRSVSHPADDVTTLTAHGDGATEVRIVSGLITHGDPGDDAEAVRAVFRAYLVRLSDELVRRWLAGQQMDQPPEPPTRTGPDR